MIEIGMIVTFKNCPLFSKNLASMVPSNEIASQHEFAAISTFNMTYTLHKNSVFYKKQKNVFEKECFTKTVGIPTFLDKITNYVDLHLLTYFLEDFVIYM